MNTCVVCLGEENSDNLVSYNHCGLYYIHKECLDRWPNNECIICRERLPEIDTTSKTGIRIAVCIIYGCIIIMLSTGIAIEFKLI